MESLIPRAALSRSVPKHGQRGRMVRDGAKKRLLAMTGPVWFDVTVQ